MTEPDTHQWTLITVTFNSADRIREFWTPPPADVEWIVVDNASTDDTLEAARELGATKILELPTNMGFGAANNLGFAAASADLIGFVNPDVSVDYESLPKLGVELDNVDGLIAPQLLNSDGSLQPNGRGFPLVINKLRNRGKKSDELVDQYLLLSKPGQARKVCWVIGAVLLGKRSTFDSLGAWDDRFFIYYEDADICLRAWKQGIPTLVLGDYRWVHGWSRDTIKFRWGPWRREIASLTKFYLRYPFLTLSLPAAQRRYPAIARALADGDQATTS